MGIPARRSPVGQECPTYGSEQRVGSLFRSETSAFLTKQLSEKDSRPFILDGFHANFRRCRGQGIDWSQSRGYPANLALVC